MYQLVSYLQIKGLIYTEISGGLWNWIKMVGYGYINKVFHFESVQYYFFYKCTMVYVLSNTWNTIRVLEQNGTKKSLPQIYSTLKLKGVGHLHAISNTPTLFRKISPLKYSSS